MRKRAFVHYLPIYGCLSTGLIYTGIGVVAILSFLKVRHGGADESSLMAILNDHLAGKVLLWLILLGTLSYIGWRIYEAITDPYGYGKSRVGLSKRTGIGLSAIADILIASSAIRIILGAHNIQVDGQPVEERQMVSNLLDEPWGAWVVVSIGVIYLITDIVQLIYGITRGYQERIDIEHFHRGVRNTIHILAWAGYLARGVILGIIGFFVIKAGVLKSARHVVNTDKAFDFIGDEVGHVYFILVAIGTICYGLFMFAQAVAYDTDKD